MSSDEPSHVPDEVIAAEAAVKLPKRRLRNGDRVQIITGLLAGRCGRYAGASHRHIRVLPQLFGGERQVRLDREAIEQV